MDVVVATTENGRKILIFQAESYNLTATACEVIHHAFKQLIMM